MDWRLIDTNVISFIFKRDTRAEKYRPHLSHVGRAISLMTIAELQRWAFEREWGRTRKERLTRQLEQFVVFPIDRELAGVWAEVHDDLRRQGRAISDADAWIAATALIQGLPLVTHNRRDFEHVPGLDVISEAPVNG